MSKLKLSGEFEVVIKGSTKNIIKQNIPYNKLVDKREFDKFVENNYHTKSTEYFGGFHRGSSEYVESYFDVYGNTMAYSLEKFDGHVISYNFYINPKLLQLGVEQKCKIENDVERIGYEHNLGMCVPCSIEKMIDESSVRCGVSGYLNSDDHIIDELNYNIISNKLTKDTVMGSMIRNINKISL